LEGYVSESASETSDAAEKFRKLPDPVRLEDTITSAAASSPADPEAGRNIEQDQALGHRDNFA
jgi:hypothetical protein